MQAKRTGMEMSAVEEPLPSKKRELFSGTEGVSCKNCVKFKPC